MNRKDNMIEFEKITPATAEKWLNHNKSNRKLRDGVAEKYATDMKGGNWTKCPTPISFYEDGDLADGQHRLWAIVMSDTTQSFLVLRGLSRQDGLNIDTGLNRNVVDSGRISGKDTGLSLALIAVARGIDHGSPNSGALSNATRLELVSRHREAAQFGLSHGPRTKFMRNAIVHAAIGRAWYIEADKDKLRRFCAVMDTGLPIDQNEFAAIAMRNYLLQKGPLAATTSMWRDTFLKAQNCIYYFMRGKSLKVVRTVTDEAYPLKGRSVISQTPRVKAPKK